MAIKGTRTFLVLAVLAAWSTAGPLSAQEPPLGLQVVPLEGDVPQFRKYQTVEFSRAPVQPGGERSESTIGPDAPQTIIRVGAQIGSRTKINEEDADFQIRTDLPGPDRLFDTRKSEAMMREYIRRDSGVRTGADRILFPEYPPLTKDPFVPRAFARSSTLVEPNYVCHGRLLFEQLNFERAGWDIGYLTPGLTLAVFYYDAFMMPYHTWTNPCQCYDCNAGKCLPGDATPFLLYREPFSLSGLAGQTLAVGTGFFAFP